MKPPYARRAIEALSDPKLVRPDFLFVCMGNQAWDQVKAWEQQGEPRAYVVIPSDKMPADYSWVWAGKWLYSQILCENLRQASDAALELLKAGHHFCLSSTYDLMLDGSNKNLITGGACVTYWPSRGEKTSE